MGMRWFKCRARYRLPPLQTHQTIDRLTAVFWGLFGVFWGSSDRFSVNARGKLGRYLGSIAAETGVESQAMATAAYGARRIKGDWHGPEDRTMHLTW